jgi:hypothetical protein
MPDGIVALQSHVSGVVVCVQTIGKITGYWLPGKFSPFIWK